MAKIFVLFIGCFGTMMVASCTRTTLQPAKSAISSCWNIENQGMTLTVTMHRVKNEHVAFNVGISLSSSTNWQLRAVEMIKVRELSQGREIQSTKHPLMFSDEFGQGVDQTSEQSFEQQLKAETDSVIIEFGTLHSDPMKV